MKKCAIVIPVYNEEKIIAETISSIKEAISGINNILFEIICVNDGSTDKTGEILSQIKNIKILTHNKNQGYGASLKAGIDSYNSDLIIITDADGTYPIKDIPKLIKEITATNADMVVGNRKGSGITSNKLKFLARLILKKLAFLTTGTTVPDLNSGFRIFKKSLYLEFKPLFPSGFSFTSTITLSSLLNGYKINYIPIDYANRIGESKISPFVFFKMLWLILKLPVYFKMKK